MVVMKWLGQRGGGGKVGVYMCRLLSDDSKNANLHGDLDTEIGFR